MNSLPVRVAAACLLLSLAACRHEDFDPGEIRSQTRVVDAFDAIDMDGSARLEITVGQPLALSLSGPEPALARAHVEVDSHTLRIKTRYQDMGWTRSQARITFKIAVPELAALRLQGGNDVTLTGFKGGTWRLDVDGAARVRASGELDRLTVDMEGAGLADLGELVARDTQVTVDGIGRVVVHPQDSLNATMNGIGAILYVGHPREVNTHMNGVGTISQRDHNDGERELRREQRKQEKERRRQEREAQEWQPERPAAPPPIDPETLQPEYDDRPGAQTAPARQPVPMTEVI